MPDLSLLVASSDESFRQMVRDSMLNLPNTKIAAEYQEVPANLHIRVLQDLERAPGAGLIVDLSADPEAAIKPLPSKELFKPSRRAGSISRRCFASRTNCSDIAASSASLTDTAKAGWVTSMTASAAPSLVVAYRRSGFIGCLPK